MPLGWLLKKSGDDNRRKPEEIISAFEKKITRHNDLIFGLGLFFECIGLLYAGQEDIIETYRKQFRNMISQGQTVADRAMSLVEESKTDSEVLPLLEQFNFTLCEHHTEPEKLVRRCEILVTVYERQFPGRARDQAFADEEIFQLMEAASLEMAKVGDVVEKSG